MSCNKVRNEKATKPGSGSWACDPATGQPTDPQHPWNRGGGAPMLPSFDRQLLNLEHAFRFEGVRLAALEAMLLCQKRGRVWPEWLHEAALAVSLALFTEGLPRSAGRTGNEIAEFREYLRHYVRWATVDEIRDYQCVDIKPHRALLKKFAGDAETLAKLNKFPPPDFGTTWPECYAAASKQLRGTDAQGSAETMKASYRLMQCGKAKRFPRLHECARHLGFQAC